MVKLFADGAIFSQLMQVREPYIDGHQGEWMTDLDVFERAFRIYWDAGYQIHIHVNGDAGVDRVLNALEKNIRRNPRYNHRTTIVHFVVSAKDQVARIKQLGCLVIPTVRPKVDSTRARRPCTFDKLFVHRSNSSGVFLANQPRPNEARYAVDADLRYDVGPTLRGNQLMNRFHPR
jgi:predicted amidohydrolase YtcJ